MKKLLYILIAVLLLVVVVLAVITSLVDTNKVKAMLSEQVKAKTGADLVITGDLSWRFFPRLGFTLGKTELRNPGGYSEPNLIQFSSASMDLAVEPLFDRHIEVGVVVLSGVKINLLTKANGKTNLDDFNQTMAKQVNKKAPPNGESEPTAPAEPAANYDLTLKIAGVAIESGQLLLRDEATKKQQLISNVNFEASDLAFAQAVPVKLSADYAAQGLVARLGSTFNLTVNQDLDVFEITKMKTKSELAGDAIPDGEQTILLDADLRYQVANKTAEITALKLKVFEHTLNGSASLQQASIPVIKFDLSAEKLDLDAILAKFEDKQKTVAAPNDNGAVSTETNAPKNTASPDLSVLSAIDLSGNLAINQLRVANAQLEQVQVAAKVAKGVMTLSEIKAQLYQGQLNGKFSLDGKPKVPTFTLQQNLTGVQVLPLMVAVADLDKLAGAMDADINLSGAGLNDQQVRASLTGTAKLKLVDGALTGINVAQMVRKGQAKLKGENVDTVGEKKTDFSALTGSFKIAKGVASTTDLDMDSPALRVAGKGNTNLINETLDFLVNVAVVGSLKGQGGKSEDELKNINVPLKIAGTWQEPAYSLDMEALLKQEMQQHGDKLKEKLDEQIDRKIKDEGTKAFLKKLPLKGLFN